MTRKLERSDGEKVSLVNIHGTCFILPEVMLIFVFVPELIMAYPGSLSMVDGLHICFQLHFSDFGTRSLKIRLWPVAEHHIYNTQLLQQRFILLVFKVRRRGSVRHRLSF